MRLYADVGGTTGDLCCRCLPGLFQGFFLWRGWRQVSEPVVGRSASPGGVSGYLS